jgi:hypothetical protein
MTDFVPEPRDRLEAPICKAIESQDFKQALKLVEKRLAKRSDSYLLVCILISRRPSSFVLYPALRPNSDNLYLVTDDTTTIFSEHLRIPFGTSFQGLPLIHVTRR